MVFFAYLKKVPKELHNQVAYVERPEEFYVHFKFHVPSLNKIRKLTLQSNEDYFHFLIYLQKKYFI